MKRRVLAIGSDYVACAVDLADSLVVSAQGVDNKRRQRDQKHSARKDLGSFAESVALLLQTGRCTVDSVIRLTLCSSALWAIGHIWMGVVGIQ